MQLWLGANLSENECSSARSHFGKLQTRIQEIRSRFEQ
jgi:hypothetical protein